MFQQLLHLLFFISNLAKLLSAIMHVKPLLTIAIVLLLLLFLTLLRLLNMNYVFV